MLHELVGSRTQSKPTLSPEETTTGPLCSAYLTNSFSFGLSESNKRCFRKSSSAVLPEISEFLREETIANAQSQPPFSGSFVKFLELDDPNACTSSIESSFCRSDHEHDTTTLDPKRLRFDQTSSVADKSSSKFKKFYDGDKRSSEMHDDVKKKETSASPHLIKNALFHDKQKDRKINSKTLNSSDCNLMEKPQVPSLLSVNISNRNDCNSTDDQNMSKIAFTNSLLDGNSINNQTHSVVFSESGKNRERVLPTANQYLMQNPGSYYGCPGNPEQILSFNDITSTEQFYNSSITSDFLELCNNKGLHFSDSNATHLYKGVPTNQNPNLLVKYTDNVAFIKTEQRDPIAKFFSINQTNPTQSEEEPWNDTKKITQPIGDSHLQLNNSLLDDVDLSGVDSACMEQFEREYQQEALKETEHACTVLKIPIDAEEWTEFHVDKWVMWTAHQCNLPAFNISDLRMSGAELCKLGEAEMLSRVPTCGDIIHARLSIWKSASKTIENQGLSEFHENGANIPQNSNSLCMNEPANLPSIAMTMHKQTNKISESDAATQLKPPHTSSIHLWMFLKELLLQPELYGQFIRWIDKDEGIFKIEDSMEVARLWGVRKNRPAMNYDKLSRSIRQYYKKGIIKKTPVSQRLVYQFVNPTLTMSI